jgi:hypothetical protein
MLSVSVVVFIKKIGGIIYGTLLVERIIVIIDIDTSRNIVNFPARSMGSSPSRIISPFVYKKGAGTVTRPGL